MTYFQRYAAVKQRRTDAQIAGTVAWIQAGNLPAWIGYFWFRIFKERAAQKIRSAKWYGKNFIKARQTAIDFQRKTRPARYKTDTQLRVSTNLRNRVRSALRGVVKSGSTFELLGCAREELLLHLERQFKPGMSWENYGRDWHVDHIRACANYDMTDPHQQRECFSYKNLQPLWALENLRKGSRCQ